MSSIGTFEYSLDQLDSNSLSNFVQRPSAFIPTSVQGSYVNVPPINLPSLYERETEEGLSNPGNITPSSVPVQGRNHDGTVPLIGRIPVQGMQSGSNMPVQGMIPASNVPMPGIIPASNVPMSGIIPGGSVPMPGKVDGSSVPVQGMIPAGNVPVHGMIPAGNVPMQGMIPAGNVPMSGQISARNMSWSQGQGSLSPLSQLSSTSNYSSPTSSIESRTAALDISSEGSLSDYNCRVSLENSFSDDCSRFSDGEEEKQDLEGNMITMRFIYSVFKDERKKLKYLSLSM